MPTLSFEKAKEILKRENEEFARIYQKHRQLDAEVRVLEERRYLTPEEEIREKQLKKDKLRLKDKMAEMIRVYQESKQA
jgi:uncharacterized protein YdcH (DUF465 family)